MDIFTQQLINGLVLGSIYALVALGYTMVYGILELINFAHGEVTMIGAMVALTVIGVLMGVAPDLPGLMVVFGGLLIAIPACMALAFGIEKIAYRPLRRAPRLAPLITAIGVSIILQNLAMLVWGRQYVSFPPILPRGQHEILGAHITDLQIFIVVLSFSLMAGLWLLVERTRLGRAMRATAQSREVAELMGVNVDRVISATFVIGAAIAAIAGVMVSAYYGLAHYYMGFMLGLKAFSAAVLGGIGNIAGAMLGGLLLGVIEALGAGYIGDITGGFLGSHYQDVFAFFVLILVLVFRPSGLMGERVAEAVHEVPGRPARLTLVLLAASLLADPALRGGRGSGQFLGAHARFRPALRVAGPGPEHRGGLRRPARSGLHRLLRPGRLSLCLAGQPPFRPASAVLGRCCPWARPWRACLACCSGRPPCACAATTWPSSPWASARSSASS
jgi:branched-chain amino acid transport system permease protein